MTTLRKAVAQALDALTKIHPGNMSWETGEAWLNAVQILREALAQPEPEPVAWMDSNGDVYPMPETEGWRLPHTLLYTAPPQRKRLPPQSPCEMTQAKRKMFRLGWLECEAAHGIKGEQHG